MNIVFANRQRTRKVNLRLLKEITGDLLASLRIQNADLGINLVAAAQMTSLNETFLQHAGSTDVITFDYAGQAAGARAACPRDSQNASRGRAARVPLHGEIFICVDEALIQARKFKTNWQSEVIRYIVHGVLHLLGHDDLHPAARRKMKREENRLVRELARRFRLRGPATPAIRSPRFRNESRRLGNRRFPRQAY